MLLLKDFNATYDKFKSEKQKNIVSKSAIEDEYNFTISEEVPVKIIELEGVKYYNILIDREVKDSTYFEI